MRSTSERPGGAAILRGFFWQYAAFWLQALVQFVVLAILSRKLSAVDFGVIGVAMVFVHLSQIMVQLGVGPAIVQCKDLREAHVTTAFYTSAIGGMLSFVGLYMAAPWLGGLFDERKLVEVLRWLGLSFVLASLSVVSYSLLTRELRFKSLMIVSLASYITGYGVFGITFALLGYGVWSLVIAVIVQSLTRTVLLFVGRPHSVRFDVRLKEWRQLIIFGAGFTLTRLLNFGATDGDRFVISQTLSVADLGLYTRAYALMMFIGNQIGATLEKVIFPVMSAWQEDKSRLGLIYMSSSAIVALVTYPALAFLIVYADDLVRVVLGPAWSEVVLPFQILCLSLSFRTSYKLGDSVAKATGRVYRRSVREGIYAASVVAGVYFGSRYGLSGAVAAVSGSILLNFVMSFTMACSIIGISPRRYLQTQLPGLVIGGAVLCVSTATKAGMEYLGGVALLNVAVGGLVAAIVASGWIRLYPRAIGSDAGFVLEMIVKHAPKRWRIAALLTRISTVSQTHSAP